MNRRLLTLAGGALLLMLVSACGEPAAPPPPVIRPVLSVVAHAVSSATIGPYVGSIAPRYQTPLSFQSSGRIIARPVNIGDTVKSGQLLASLDASLQQFQLASAEADLASAQSQFTNLSASEERAKSLVASGASAQAQLDAATSARQTAEAQLAQARANLARAQDQLGYTSITAGFDGVVIAVGAEVGQVVGAGQTVVTIARPDVREAVFELSETEAASLAGGVPWKVAIVGAEDEVTTGTIREVSPLINGSTRTQTVRLTLDAPPETFRLGATVSVSQQRPIAPQFTLPPTALLDADGKTEVWVVDPKALTVATKSVTVGEKSDDAVAVTGGIAEGDVVVVAGVHSLTAGQQVKLDGAGS